MPENTNISKLRSETVDLHFGPQHPATHGTLRVDLTLDGETVEKAIPHIGYLHTGFEKLAESMNYNQFITVTDRMNYLSPVNNNIGFALAVEKLMGIEVPPRGQYMRLIMSEIGRIGDHCCSVGAQCLDLGAFTAYLYLWEGREESYNLFERSAGARMTTSWARIGGCFRDFPDGFFDEVKKFIKMMHRVLKDTEILLNHNNIFVGRTKGLSAITADQAIDYGITGPCLRATGLAWDLRKAQPYCSYEDMDFDIPVGENGDVYDRYLVRMEEMKQSMRILEQAMEKIPDGPYNYFDKKVILPEKENLYEQMESLIHHFEVTMENKGFSAPVGEIYHSTEAPIGELGWYIISNGKREPYKVRVRPPSLHNFQRFGDLLKGGMLSDTVALLGSLNVIAGELDR